MELKADFHHLLTVVTIVPQHDFSFPKLVEMMTLASPQNLIALVAVFLFSVVPLTLHACQLEEVQRMVLQQKADVAIQVAEADDKKNDEADEDADEEETPITDTAAMPSDVEEIGDQFIRFHMWDGSIMGGDVSVKAIDVETEFGMLTVPIDKILKFYPGLDSLPDLDSRIRTLVENLGDREFEVREQSHRELLSLGAQIRGEIQNYDDGGSAERKKHLEEIKKQIDEMLDEFENPQVDSSLIRGDTIVTDDFSIVGKIKQDQFQMGSKFGQLNIKLADIKLADRTFNLAQDDVRKSVKVEAKDFFQTSPRSTKIRVNRGDRISIRASGTVNWTNWSQSCGPDGMTNQGEWQGINSGTLTARIGKSGKLVKVGSREDFTAKESGVLYLGIAIRDNYARNSSYRWTGHYDVKIVVEPAEK